SGVGPFDAEDRFHHRRLARSVWSDQAENLSGMNREADVPDGGQSAEPLEEALDLKLGRRGAHVASRAPLTMPSNPPGKVRTTASATYHTPLAVVAAQRIRTGRRHIA